MNSVVHFEMPFDDRERMVRFYQSAFGWQTELLGAEMGNYVVATTAETVDSRPVTPGTINGGFYMRRSGSADQHPSVVIAVDDVNEGIARIKAAGGTMLGEPMEIPGVGLYASFHDSEGNRVSILQPAPRANSAQ